MTALHYAVRVGHISAIELLLSAKADVNAKNRVRKGTTLLLCTLLLIFYDI